jgi:hypothetical protein
MHYALLEERKQADSEIPAHHAQRGIEVPGLHPCDHSIAKVNISEKVLYTTAERAEGDARCEAEHIVENLSC